MKTWIQTLAETAASGKLADLDLVAALSAEELIEFDRALTRRANITGVISNPLEMDAVLTAADRDEIEAEGGGTGTP